MTFELKGCDEKSFLLFLKQWEIYHHNNDKDYFNNLESYEEYVKEREIIEKIYKELGSLAENNDFVSGVQAIYYFGRDNENKDDFYKEYCDFYNSYYNSHESLECRLNMLFEKTNFKLSATKTLLKLKRKDVLKNITIDDDCKNKLNITDNDLI